MSDQIFICYRRNDSAYVTGHIYDRLRREFGDEAIFTDVDRIDLGVDFRATLDQIVSECQILLAVVGQDWLTIKNEKGEHRLQDPEDFVRIEIESALHRKIPIIPLLVEGTTMPSKDNLPASMQDFSFRNGTKIRPAPDFHTDIERLIKSLKRHLHALSKKTEPARKEHPASSVGREDDLEQKRLPAGRLVQRTANEKQNGGSKVNVRVEEEEKWRHQAEQESWRQTTQKRSSAPFWVIGFVLVASVSWYFAAQNREKVDAVIAELAATFSTTAADEIRLKSDADAEARFKAVAAEANREALREADAAAEARREVGAEVEANREPDDVAEAKREVGAEVAANREANDDAEAKREVGAEVAANREADDVAEAKREVGAEVEANREADDAEAKREAVAEAKPEAATADEVGLKVDADAGAKRDAAAAEAEREAVAASEARLKAEASAFIREGVRRAAHGDYLAAIQNFDAAIRLNAEPAFIHKQRGASYHALGDYEAAVEDFNEAIRLNYEDANAYFKRSASHRALGNQEASERDRAIATELDAKWNDSR